MRDAPTPENTPGSGTHDSRRGTVVRINWPDGSSSTGTFLTEEGAPGRRFARILEDDDHPYCDPDEDVVRVPLDWVIFRARKRDTANPKD